MRISREDLTTVATVAALGLFGASSAHADYIADFDTTGSSDDFTAVHESNVATGSFTEVSDGGNDYLQVSATAEQHFDPGGQLRFIGAPTESAGSQVLFPTGELADPVRTEAHMGLTYMGLTGAEPGNEDKNPFVAFGLMAYDTTTGEADYRDKLIVQITNTEARVTLSSSRTNIGPNNRATFDLSEDVSAGDEFEIQATEDLFRVLHNGAPLTSDDTDSDGYANLGVDFSLFNGDSLTPFAGVIRGSDNVEAGDTFAAGFDDFSVQNVVIPEPATLGLLGMAGLGLLRRRRD